MQKTAIGSGLAHGGSCSITKTCLPGRQALLVMKLIVVLLTAAFVNVSAEGLSQNVSYSGKECRHQVCFSGSGKTNRLPVRVQRAFIAARETCRRSKPAIFRCNNSSVCCSKSQPVDYMIRSKTILLFRKTADAVSEEPARSFHYQPTLPLRP